MTEATNTTTETNSTPVTPVTPTPDADVQAKIDAVAANVRKEASAAAVKKLLEGLGVESADQLKEIIKAKKDADEANKTELEKLAGAAQSEAKKRAELEAELATIKQQQQKEKRDSAVVKALTGAKANAAEAEDLMLLLQAKYGDLFNGVMDESGAMSEKGIKALVTKAQEVYPKYFASSAPGSPSNYDGRVPDTNKDRVKSILGDKRIAGL